jgi:hypothetical protein
MVKLMISDLTGDGFWSLDEDELLEMAASSV